MRYLSTGGYTGDTIIALAAFWGKNKWKKVYSWEPDEINRNKLIETCKIHGFENVEIVPYGLWSEKTELHFNMQGKDWSRVSPDSANIVTVDSIDHLCSEERITYIKMDIERSELQALRGAQNVIRRDRPRLAISIYHKPEDYYEIPFYVKSLVPEYKLYIRHHKSSKNDTVLYAVCP